MSETAVYEGKVGEVVEILKGMTALELAELKKAIEETFDVTAAAPVAVMAGAGTAQEGGGEAEAEKDSFSVRLTGHGSQKIQVIKAVRALLSLGLKEAKDFVEKAASEPQVMKEAASKEEVEKIKEEVEAVGGSVEVS